MNSNTICVKKTFPAKYLKYLSYGIHIMKQLYPADEEYQQKVAEYLKFSESVNVIIDDIESSLTDENETEVKELKKSLAKKPKRIRNKKPANAPSTITLTEQIVELANEPTIKRGPVDEVEYVIAMSDSEGEEEVKVVVEVKETPKKVTKPKKAKVVKPVVVEEVKVVVEEVKVVVEEVIKPAVVEEVNVVLEEVVKEVVKVVEEVIKPAVVEEVIKPAVVEEVIKPVVKKVTKKVKKADIDDNPCPTAEVVEEVVIKEQLDVDVPKKVSKPRVKKVVEKKPVEVQGPTLVVEELTEENEV